MCLITMARHGRAMDATWRVSTGGWTVTQSEVWEVLLSCDWRGPDPVCSRPTMGHLTDHRDPCDGNRCQIAGGAVLTASRGPGARCLRADQVQHSLVPVSSFWTSP